MPIGERAIAATPPVRDKADPGTRIPLVIGAGMSGAFAGPHMVNATSRLPLSIATAFWHIPQRGGTRPLHTGSGGPATMRIPVLLLLLASSAPLGAAGDGARLPLTIDERNTACAEVEDADPARAIALADSVLGEPIAPEPLQRAEALGCRGWAQASSTPR